MEGSWIILEYFNPDFVGSVCNEEGQTLYFDSEEDAIKYAAIRLLANSSN